MPWRGKHRINFDDRFCVDCGSKTTDIQRTDNGFYYPVWFVVERRTNTYRCKNCNQKLCRRNKKLERQHQEVTAVLIEHISKRDRIPPEEITIEWAK